MKKIVCLILALCCVLSFAACSNTETTDPEQAFFDVIAASNPTKITTLTSYNIEGEKEPFVGSYDTKIEEDGFVFEYSYMRYARVGDVEKENVVVDGNIATVSGVVYYANGKYSTDNENWSAEAPAVTSNQFKLNIAKENLGEYKFNDAKTTLSTTVTAEQLAALLGVTLTANSDIALSISTNGSYLTLISISYTTDNATVKIETSYS
jgi:hypothetical protein